MMRTTAILIGVVVVGGGTAATVMARGNGIPSVTSMSHHERHRPGADSTRIAITLDALGRTDAVICEMIGDQVGNFWSSGEAGGVGRLADAGASSEMAKDSLAGEVTDPAAIRLLASRLANDNACVRRVAAKLLGRSDVSDAIMNGLFRDPSPRVREAAALASGEGEHPGLRLSLEHALDDNVPAAVAMAVWALGESQDHSAIPALLRIARSNDSHVRLTVIVALGEMEDVTVAPELTIALRDAQPLIRAAAARGVGQSEHHGSATALIPLLSDGVPAVRQAAVDAIGELEDATAVSAVERALGSDRDGSVRLSAAKALGNLSSVHSADVLARALEDADPEVRLAAAEALGDLDELHVAPAALVRAASSADAELRKQAIHTLGSIADPATTSVLLGLVTDADREIRLAAVQGLGEIGTAAVVPGLTRALKDSDAEIRRVAAEKLGEIKDN